MKEAIEEEVGCDTSLQELYFMGQLMEDEETKISEFLELGFGSPFNLIARDTGAGKIFGSNKPAR